MVSPAFGWFDLGLPNADGVAGLQGVYSTTASSVTTQPNTLSSLTPMGPWQNLSNILTEDGSYATVSGSPPAHGSCPLVSDSIVVTGWTFSPPVPAGANILGIGVGVKGHFSPVGSNTQTGNFALMLNGTPYWYYDPRAFADDCGYSITPESPYGSYPPAQDPGDEGASNIGSYDIHFNPFDTVSGYDFFPLGSMPGCAGNGLIWQGVYGPLFKGFFSQLKQSWLASEVNDPSFGFAMNWGLDCGSGYVSDSPSNTLLLDCFGIAIYYTPGTGPTTRRQPNVCINT
jgi:hypothetical protein